MTLYHQALETLFVRISDPVDGQPRRISLPADRWELTNVCAKICSQMPFARCFAGGTLSQLRAGCLPVSRRASQREHRPLFRAGVRPPGECPAADVRHMSANRALY